MKLKSSYLEKLAPVYVTFGYFLIILIIVSYFVFWWTFKLELFPGLHADEAWVGLEAIRHNKSNPGRLSSMNNYTGVLQIFFTSLSFRWLGMGVFELRIPGATLNLAGLLMIIYFFHLNKLKRAMIIFLIIISQAVLFILSPRIAWEVNSFTFFLIASLLVCVTKLNTKNLSNSRFWLAAFFVINIIGTYNHVIFSCISLSALLGVVLWSMRNKSLQYSKFIKIGALNLLNLLTLFILMRFMFSIDYGQLFTLIIFAIIVCIECFGLTSLLDAKMCIPFSLNLYVIVSVSIVSMCLFVFFHGFSFLQVITNYMVLTHVFSYNSSILEKTVYILGGAIYLFFLFRYLLHDLSVEGGSIIAFIIILYLGVINIYTIECSFRYYLSIFYLTAIYLSIRLSQSARNSIMVTSLLLFSALVTNIALISVFTNPDRIVRPQRFLIGNNKVETSAHFLNTLPLVEFLKEQNTLSIQSSTNPYFLEKPVQFYYKTNPWQYSSKNIALVDYDYYSHNGFITRIVNK